MTSTATSSPPTLPPDDLAWAPVTIQAPAAQNFSNDSYVVLFDNMTVSSTEDPLNNGADIAIASLEILFIIISLVGNTVSLIYFVKKAKLTLPSFLYIVIIVFDICISITAFPVIASLLNSRTETLFGNNVLCASWPPIFYFLKRMSMFLVMMISLTRSMVIAFPFLKIGIKFVSIVTAIYAAILVIVDVVYLSIDGLFKTRYRKQESSCEIYFTTKSSAESASKSYSILLQLELIIPCIIVFVSFILCLVFLAKAATEVTSDGTKKFRRASTTITLFAGLFLACNIPAFLLQLKYLVLYLKDTDDLKEISRGPFMESYGHLLSHFFLALFNAAINPCLYLLRMPDFRQWLKMVVKDPGMLTRNARESIKATTSTFYTTGSRYCGQRDQDPK